MTIMTDNIELARQEGYRAGMEAAAKICDDYAEAIGCDASAVKDDPAEMLPDNRRDIVNGLLARQSAVRLSALAIRRAQALAAPAMPERMTLSDDDAAKVRGVTLALKGSPHTPNAKTINDLLAIIDRLTQPAQEES